VGCAVVRVILGRMAEQGVCSVHQRILDILSGKVVIPFQFWMFHEDVIVVPVLIKSDRSTEGCDADEARSAAQERRRVYHRVTLSLPARRELAAHAVVSALARRIERAISREN
jgi:hypothetical protein